MVWFYTYRTRCRLRHAVKGHVTGVFHHFSTARHSCDWVAHTTCPKDGNRLKMIRGHSKSKNKGHGIGDKCVTLFGPTAGTKPNILREDR
jgi:hypothetical protein